MGKPLASQPATASRGLVYLHHLFFLSAIQPRRSWQSCLGQVLAKEGDCIVFDPPGKGTAVQTGWLSPGWGVPLLAEQERWKMKAGGKRALWADGRRLAGELQGTKAESVARLHLVSCSGCQVSPLQTQGRRCRVVFENRETASGNLSDQVSPSSSGTAPG